MRVAVMLLIMVVPGEELRRCAAAAQAQEPVAGEERPRVFCGRMLADARMLYCFNEDIQKRSVNPPLIASLYPREQQKSWPWIASQARALALRGKRDPGLADECCLKACYISELLAYC